MEGGTEELEYETEELEGGTNLEDGAEYMAIDEVH